MNSFDPASRATWKAVAVGTNHLMSPSAHGFNNQRCYASKGNLVATLAHTSGVNPMILVVALRYPITLGAATTPKRGEQPHCADNVPRGIAD